MLVKELLSEKGSKVHTIDGGSSVEDAVDKLVQKKIGALIVMEGNVPVGIFTERDVLRCHVKFNGTPYKKIPITQVMTDRLIVAEMGDQISDSMSTMIQADIRHLPVVEDGEIIGLLSIRDLVKHQVGTLTAEIHYLQEYITNLQDAAND